MFTSQQTELLKTISIFGISMSAFSLCARMTCLKDYDLDKTAVI